MKTKRFVLDSLARGRVFPLAEFACAWLLFDRFHAHIALFVIYWIVVGVSAVIIAFDYTKTKQVPISVEDLLGISERKNEILKESIQLEKSETL